MKQSFNEHELPLDDLQKLGMSDGKTVRMWPDDLTALLGGRRTDLLKFRDLQADGFKIDEIHARLSLERSEDGKVSLKLHPIYRTAQPHPSLNDTQNQALMDGQHSIVTKDKTGKPLVVEYDAETRTFIDYDPEKITVPEKVNNEKLTEAQKQDFRLGNIVELADGTRFQHRASESKGVVSDRKALVLSVLLDGGISYLLLRGLKSLTGSKEPQKDAYTSGYNQALKEMNDWKEQNTREQQVASQKNSAQHSRGYGRGITR